MMNRRTTLLLTLTLALSACGFKLKGLYEVPELLQQVTLIEQSAQPSALGRELVSQLTGSGVQIIEAAPYRLELGATRYNKRAITIGARAEALEYELSGSVSFALYQGDSTSPVLERQVSASRNFDDNANSIALETLESRYTTELNRALADQIVRQYLSYAPSRQ